MQRVLVVGPGALGVLIAVRAANAGHQVTAAARNPARAEAMTDEWIAVSHKGVAATANIDCIGAPSGEYDVMILATKCADARAALEQWLPCVTGPVVGIQNGVEEDHLLELCPDRFVACTVTIPASLHDDGNSEQTGPGGFILGAWPDGRMDAATPDVAALLADVAPTHVHQNMLGVKWTKLLINSAITGLGAITGRSLGELLDDPRARQAFMHIVTEGAAVGKHLGVQFERVAGFHPKMLTMKDGKAPWHRHALLRIMGFRFRRQRSSSLQSIQKGARSEVAYLNGHIAKEGSKAGISTPVNTAVAQIAERIDTGQEAPNVAHLAALPL